MEESGGGFEQGTFVLQTKGVAHCAMRLAKLFPWTFLPIYSPYFYTPETVAVFYCTTVTQQTPSTSR